MGHAFFRSGKEEKSLEWFDKAIELDPKRMITWTTKASILASIEKYEEAYKHFTEAINLAPKSILNYAGRAQCLLTLKRYEEAIQDADQILNSTEPDKANFQDGAILTKGEALEKMMESFQGEELRMAFEGLSNMYLFNQFATEGLRLTQRGLQEFPESKELLRLQGLALFFLKQYPAAADTFKAFLSKDPHNTDIRDGYLTALEKSKRYEELISAIDGAISMETMQRKEDRKQILYNLWASRSRANEALGRHDQAKSDMEKAKKIGN